MLKTTTKQKEKLKKKIYVIPDPTNLKTPNITRYKNISEELVEHGWGIVSKRVPGGGRDRGNERAESKRAPRRAGGLYNSPVITARPFPW